MIHGTSWLSAGLERQHPGTSEELCLLPPALQKHCAWSRDGVNDETRAVTWARPCPSSLRLQTVSLDSISSLL